MKLRLKQLHKPVELWDEKIPQALCNIRCLSSKAIGFESPHKNLFGFRRCSSLDQNYIDFDKSDVTPTCSSFTPEWKSQGSAVFVKNFTKKSEDDSLVQLARILRLLSPQHAVVSYLDKNRIYTITTQHSYRRDQNLSPSILWCKRASSPVKTVESHPHVGLNVSPARQSLEEASSPPLRRSGRLRNQRQGECGDYMYY